MPDGALLINGAPVNLAELESQLQQAQSRDPKMNVAIKGDARTQYAKVVEVIDLCNKLQVSMGLVTSRIGT
jgi:biopolymer transport protein ExbD